MKILPLSNSTDEKKLLVDKFKISMETNGGDASWLNGKNERHKKSIHNMVIEGLIDSNQHGKMVLHRQKHQHSFMDAEYSVF